jgi:beta-alanine degradation protein BauB
MDHPTVTDPDKYKVVFENDRVRVIEFRDKPGDKTKIHSHPQTLVIALTSYNRRLSEGEESIEISGEPGFVRWMDPITHAGENLGDSSDHFLYVEVKD